MWALASHRKWHTFHFELYGMKHYVFILLTLHFQVKEWKKHIFHSIHCFTGSSEGQTPVQNIKKKITCIFVTILSVTLQPRYLQTWKIQLFNSSVKALLQKNVMNWLTCCFRGIVQTCFFRQTGDRVWFRPKVGRELPHSVL